MSIELNTLDTGGDGTPLVVIHGLFGSADNWRSHIKAWETSHRVVAVDLRNHGRSPHVAGMGYAEMAGDVLALLDRLSISRAHLLGHSMGGKVVISLARLAPERVASLIVGDIAPVAYGHDHDSVFAGLRRVVEGRPANRREADALLAEHVSEKAVRLFLATNLVRGEAEGMALRLGLDEIQDDYESIMGEPAGSEPFTGPTLVLRGRDSHYVADEHLPALHEVLPEARLVTLEAGHWLHAEQPDAFRESIDEFLAAVESSAA